MTPPVYDPDTPLAFTIEEHETLRPFRRRLRQKAIWVVVSQEYCDFPEVVEVYLPYQIPGQVAPSWTLRRSYAGVWISDRDIGTVEGPVPLADALEIIDAILKVEMRKAVRAIPLATKPRMPSTCYCCNEV